jgi:hypothetical protein
MFHRPMAMPPAADGVLAPGCPVRVLGQAGGWYCVYDVAGSLRVLTPRQHSYLSLLDLLGSWGRLLWPAPKGSLRAFDAKAAAAGLVTAAGAATAAAWQHRLDSRGEIARGCPVHALGFARAGPAGSSAVAVRAPACVYAIAAAGPARPGLHVLSSVRHNRFQIRLLFLSHPEWLEHLWPLPTGRRHTWDAGAAAGDLLAASMRCTGPTAEVVPFRKPPPPGGR